MLVFIGRPNHPHSIKKLKHLENSKMKKTTSLLVMLLLLQGLLCFALLPNIAAQEISSMRQETLSNQSIIEMTGAGLTSDLIITKIKSSKTAFDTLAASLQSLKKAGVADAVILAMVQKESGLSVLTAQTGTTANNGENVNVPDGTEIKIMTIEEISGQKVVEGDPLTFKVAEDVKVNGKTVIAKDSIVKGMVAGAKKSGMMGRGGSLNIRVESAQTVDGQKIKLRSAKSNEGGNNTGSTVALTVLFGPLGLLRKGKAAKIKAGTVFSGYTDENKAVVAAN